MNDKITSIEKAAAEMPSYNRMFVKGELKELAKIMSEEEVVLDMLQGNYKDKQGLLVATSRRIIFIHKGIMWGMTLQDFGYKLITTVEFRTGLIDGRLVIMASGNSEEIKNVMPKNRTKQFAEIVRNKLSEFHSTSTTLVAATNVGEQLEKLASLRERGILTDEEFTQQKNKLLNS
jgi:hypothetical protein